MEYRDNQPTFNTEVRNVANFRDFKNNFDSEKEKLKDNKRSFTPNSDRKQIVDDTIKEYDTTTHKLTDNTEDEIDDKINSMKEDTNESKISNFNKFNTNESSDIDSDDISAYEFLDIEHYHVILDSRGTNLSISSIEEAMVSFAKLHVERALKKAYENCNGDKQLIVNSYPLSNIK